MESSLMSRNLRERAGPVLDEWEPIRELLRRAAREGAEVAVQVGLVVVAAVESKLAEAHRLACPEAAGDAMEAQRPRRQLRWQPELLAEPLGKVAAAPARLPRQVVDARRAGAGGQLAPCPCGLARGR